MHSFFFSELQLIAVLLLTRDSYISWSTRFVSLKSCVGFSIFDSASFLLNFSFFSRKSMDSNSFHNWNNRKSSHSFALRHFIFELQQKVWKFNDICVSWSSLKTNLEMNFLNFENRIFENVIWKLLGKYLTFLYLISLKAHPQVRGKCWQMKVFLKWWKMLFISLQKLYLFSRY